MGKKKNGVFRYADWVDMLLMVLGCLGSIGDGLTTPLTMLVLSGMINHYSVSDSNSFSNHVVDKYTLKLIYIAICVGLCAFFEGMCWTRTAERQTSRIRMEYLKSVLRQEASFFDTNQAASSTFLIVSSITSDCHTIQDTLAEKIPNFLAHISGFIFCIPAAFVLSWQLALAALPFSFMFIIPGVGFGKVYKNLGVKAKDSYVVAGSIAEQAISSIRTVYSYVGEHQTLEQFSHALQKSMNFGIKQGLGRGLMMGSMAMMYAAWAFQAWVGGILVTERGETGGAILISGICIIFGGICAMNALPNLSFISESTIAASRIFEMIDRIPVIDAEDGKGKSLDRLRGKIEFRDVEFSYPSRPETSILQGFNLKVNAGETVGLVGGSGSGKSTVIHLLERFYDPVRGDILLDGHRIRKLQLKWLRSQMGLVNQEPILFATSIKENILFGKEGASMQLVKRAAKAANAHDFIATLPDGYETQVRLVFFLFFYSWLLVIVLNPKILLLDEATSALDVESERIVQDALDQASRGRTTIVIAHRLSTIQKADRILVLESGRIVESGSHNELLQRNSEGIYSKMVQMQQSCMENDPSSSFYDFTGETYLQRTVGGARTPLAPINQISVRRSSPIWHNSPIYSISMSCPYSVDIDSSDYSYCEGLKYTSSSSQSPSQWRIWRLNAPEWKQALLGCMGAAGTGITQPIYSYCLGTIASVYFLKDNAAIKSDIRFYCFVFLGITSLSFISNLVQHYSFAIMGENLTKRVREKMLEKIMTFEIGWFDKDENTSAAICARLALEGNLVRSLVAERTSLLVQVSVTATLAFVLGLLVTWRVAIVAIAMQPLIIGSFYSRKVLMRNISEKARKTQGEGSQLASEAITNHRTIAAFSSQDRILSLFEASMEVPKQDNVKQSWISGLGLFSSLFLTTTTTALTLWYGGRLINQGLVTPKQLFQAFFILMSTGKNIADVGSMSSDIAKGANAIVSIFAVLDRNTEIDPQQLEGVKVKEIICGEVELKNVFFAYPTRPDQLIFNGLSLKIEAGTTVALVGQSGSGKSTVIGLIERFYDPKKGVILIDGIDIKSYNLRGLRLHIALVSQEPALFAGTIRNNILFGQEDRSESEIRKAAKLANAHEFISSMKDGYESQCGERGVQLSGGQKQRIALARAILKNPKILLLDEATSALDSMSETLVQEALEKMMVGRTSLVVAHRLSTIQKADSIAVIKQGKIVEKGSHSTLIGHGQSGAYYSLINQLKS
ncbi:putative multidrug resistance protein [Cucumis melo var. makuwa]|uniref:Multidrug resistance protein n=1 Tax=Cucumis melo var. makuwa TaxID=1194695 RepID=A0A5A7SUU5_CUCMM|nr:putative multidrug resistance protein [Cucumis melo var. makuwa]